MMALAAHGVRVICHESAISAGGYQADFQRPTGPRKLALVTEQRHPPACTVGIIWLETAVSEGECQGQLGRRSLRGEQPNWRR